MLQAHLLVLAGVAVCGPAWLAHNVSPSATFFNQAAALMGWAALAIWAAAQPAPAANASVRTKGNSVALAALVPALLAVGALGSLLFQRLPSSLMLSAIGLLGVAALVVVVAMRSDEPLFAAVCLATVLAGGVSVGIALVQVFAPGLADGDWIARASTAGRAGGNLRQPNHLSSLLLGAMAALVWLHETRAERSLAQALSARRAITAGLMAALALGVVLTVSRTGTVCIVLLALWGMLDKRLSRFSRVLLWLVPLVYALFWVGMTEWKASEFAGAVQLHKSDPSSSRFGIWSNTFELIKENPWFGVGWGEFNFAWSLTPFPNRPVAFFDHTHNLPLNLLVELGIPLGSLVLALLAWLLWKAFVACRITPQPEGTMVRTAFVMVLMMVVHSMLEYPLWYAYFLLPTAFALGICLGHSAPQAKVEEVVRPAPQWLRPVLTIAAIVLFLGTVFSVFDYLKVTRIFSVDDDDTTPLSYRIAEGQKSIFFAHHADYAAATVATHPSTAWKAFRRAPHLLLDTRLMMAWARAYAEKGDVERARYIADRLREFRNPDSAEFFAECEAKRPEGAPAPFQCTPATRKFTYQDFKLR
jgi:O-antigen ligase